MIKNPNIVIIGAGVSGIAAARKLIENGYVNVILLEAENRIGGRIHSVDFGGNIVDLGAQWCHGEKKNIVFDMVKEKNLLGASFNTYRENVYYESSGKQIDQQIADTLFSIFAELTYDADSLEDAQGSFGEYFLKNYKERVSQTFGENKENNLIASRMADWFHKFTLCYDSSSSWFDISAPGLLHFEECDGNPLLHWKNKGFQTILDVLMNRYPDERKALPIKDKILFKKEVCKVKWDGEQQNLNKIVVSCADGCQYEAEHVIITPSLGVLKDKYKTLFVPELPVFKQNAIEGLGIGTVNKIFLKFPSKWWPNDCPGFSLIWNDDDRMKILNQFPHGPSKDGTSWIEDIFGFYVIDSDPRTLLGWVVGKHTHEVELLSDEIIMNGCMYLLKKFLGDKYDIPWPDSMICSKWYSNPCFRGSYSYRSVESDKRNTYAKDLAEPVLSNSGNLRLLFAGEATHSTFYSSVHGAIESGFREANRIINLYKNSTELRCRIAIIGAGMAGLGAAYTLLQDRVKDVIILEARDQVGGRIQTVNVNDSIIELGAQWLHGTSNVLYKVAEKNDLILSERSDEGLGLYVRDDGYIFDDFLVRKVDFEVGKILEGCEKFVNCDEYPTSVGEYLDQGFLNFLNKTEESDNVKRLMMELYDWHVRFQVIDNSCKNLKLVSAKDWGKYSCLGKNGQQHLNIKNGYSSLINVLTKSLAGVKILLNMPVLKVNYVNDNIEIQCRDSTTIICNHVIVTLSLGALKENLLQFIPDLPKAITGSIQDLGFYGIGKLFLQYEYKWWEVEGFQLIWRSDTEVKDDRSWIRYLTGFDLVLNQPNMLVGWIGGEGIEIMEKLCEEDVGVQCTKVLRKFLKDDDIPFPVKVYRSTWTSCPWVRGGYSHTTTACDQSGSGPSTLSAPVVINGVPKVLFAGEAAHASHFSTTHGAFESGEQQARVLLNFFNEITL